MHYPVLNSKVRALGYRFMFAEAAWMMSGMNTVKHIAPYSNRISDFSDDGVFYKGAYGPKIVDQLPYVVESLADDHDTRQAVINIWRENPRRSKDVPCTLSLQFLRRGHRLHTVASMRSSDAWLGLPYDCFNFTMITCGVIALLRQKTLDILDLGYLTVNAGSGHLYEVNRKAAEECLIDFRKSFEDDVYVNPNNNDWETYEELVEALWRCAAARKEGEYPESFRRIHGVFAGSKTTE